MVRAVISGTVNESRLLCNQIEVMKNKMILRFWQSNSNVETMGGLIDWFDAYG